MFETTYNQIRELFEKSDSNDMKWVQTLSDKLGEIRPLWPDRNIIDIASDLNDYQQRTIMIQTLSYLPQKTRITKLRHHGSIHFMVLEKFMNEEDIQDLLEKFWSSQGKAKSLISSAFARLETRNREKNKKVDSPQDILVKELNNLPDHYWTWLYDDAVAWEFDQDILKILKKLDAPNAHIRKNEEERIIDSLRHMINVNYIKKSNGKDNRSKIHNAFIELLE